MNKVILVGRLTRDPDIRQAGETTIARFAVAVDRRYKQDGGTTADFPSCVAFGHTAKFIGDYFKQGMKIALEGRLQTGDYTDKDGVKRYTTEVIAENVEFAESKRTEETPANNGEWLEVPEDIENKLPFK
jgi:single-strand DNA-binding protein